MTILHFVNPFISWWTSELFLLLGYYEYSRTCFCVNMSSFYVPTSSVPISPHPHQHLLSVFLIIATLSGINWHFIVFLICSSLTISDVESLFICLLAIYISTLEKCQLNFFAHLIFKSNHLSFIIEL